MKGNIMKNRFSNFYIPNKSQIKFENINKALFEDLRDEEINKLNRLTDTYKEQIKNLIESNKIDGFGDMENMDIENLCEWAKTKSDKKSLHKKLDSTKEKYKKNKKDYLNETLLLSDDDLERIEFYAKYKELR
jgi:hypothetical protein